MIRAREVWIVDDDETIRIVLDRALAQRGFRVRQFETNVSIFSALQTGEPDVIITDIRLPDADGLTVLDQLNELDKDVPVIAMTAYSDLNKAVAAFQQGAFDYLPKPFDLDQVISVVERAVEQNGGEVSDSNEPARSGLLGESPAMQEIFRTIGRLSRSDINVLITGETGSGKELVARALHQHSPRAGRPFVAINTAAIPQELLESELFGHERGAFTGAHSQRIGRFEQAAGGTLFLDEIGDMPLPLQTRLLRVLAEGDFYRVGGRDLLKSDVRVIAATHQDLEDKIRLGSFREDLYHRINVIHIDIPPLRDRAQDVGLLAEAFLSRVARELGLEEKRFRSDTLELLGKYHWPGNVRQLLNLCRQLCVMAPGEQLLPQDIPATISGRATPAHAPEWVNELTQWANTRLGSADGELMNLASLKLEAALMELALRHTGGQREKAAKLLGIGRNTLTRKLKQHPELDGPEAKKSPARR